MCSNPIQNPEDEALLGLIPPFKTWPFAQGTSYHTHIATIDSSQGSEYDCVIADFVVTEHRELGFTRDETRCNVAFTRAKSVFVALLPSRLAEVTDGTA